jgi:hypothetical protein
VSHSRSHGSTRNGVGAGGSTNPGAEDVDTRSPDVDDGAVVRERCLAVARVDGTDGVGGSNTGRASAAGIDVAVTSSDGKVETASNSGADSRVYGGVGTTTKRHGSNRGAAAGTVLVVCVVDSGNNIRVGAGARVGQD